MSSIEFLEFVSRNRERVESALVEALPRSHHIGAEKFNEALYAAVFPGGKRFRAYATMIAARLGGSSDDQALTLACAIEFLHTCSLVLDDLPSMDDADLRRGQPALHLAFGEGTAILVALSLLNHAYVLLAHATPANRVHVLLAEVTNCIGSNGMIAGQATELAFSGAHPAGDVMASRNLKTTALMRLMLVAGAVGAGRSREDIDALAAYGNVLGKIFQTYDDLADVLGNRASTGKSVGQDARHTRPSQARSGAFPVTNPEQLMRNAGEMLVSGKAALDRFAELPETLLLKSVADFVLERFASVETSQQDGKLPDRYPGTAG